MLRNPEQFEKRHIGPNEQQTQQMLEAVGVESIDQLINETVPASIRMKEPLNLPSSLTEVEMLAELRKIGKKNKIFKSYIGLGYYDTFTPGVIQRNILENPGWYTQYTPYQAEIAQGRLEALLNFQTMITDLTAMDIANASLLDEGTSAAEAMIMLWHARPKGRGNKFYVANDCFPQTIDILKTRSNPLGIELVITETANFKFDDDHFGALVQYPSVNGNIQNYEALCKDAHENGATIAVAADLLSLSLLTPPGEWGADVVVGSTQRFGIPMGYGGPHAAYFATKDAFKRDMPGRLIGVSIDMHGNQAYRMALQTREQHIRREKATSNICTSQVLLAVMAGMYAVYHGPQGIKNIAEDVHRKAQLLEMKLKELGFTQNNKDYFDTLLFSAEGMLEKIRTIALENEMNFLYNSDDTISISINETTTLADVNEIVSVFAKAIEKEIELLSADDYFNLELPELDANIQRKSEYLTHPIFNSYHSETEMLRYIRGLESKDLSLVHSMIPLGSCTMKLNATTEMKPISFPVYANIHPFVPMNQAEGYAQIFKDLSDWLCEITGFAGMSLQPNSGAQGEYAGLMVIREYLRNKGEEHRNIALIPSSAHGTNPASAVMAGMKVVVTGCDAHGNIDVEELKRKAEEHKDNLACLMITYPSTHGVFEEGIKEICEVIHANGGQVYMDGANMNAQVGLTSPGLIGADVCHLNLHKTFCIPHGGGGPGMGPIGVAKHLVPFLPGHALVETGGEKAISAVSAAPWGSASILLISYAYIRMMGAKGLTEATRYAILNANYIKARLEGYYPVLYSGRNNRCAHEMILDTRKFKQTAGIEVEDIAKRLMDYGFHAPTVSFPVAGTLMIEPTESESKPELDRFCDALILIRKEIEDIENGLDDRTHNVLKNAPHTSITVTADAWPYSYPRSKAAYPADWLRQFKFWPSVGRVNSSYGDRNLMCACPPIEEYIPVDAE